MFIIDTLDNDNVDSAKRIDAFLYINLILGRLNGRYENIVMQPAVLSVPPEKDANLSLR